MIRQHSTAILVAGLLLVAAGYLAAFTIAGAALIVVGVSLLAFSGSMKLGPHPGIALVVAVVAAAVLSWLVLQNLD